MGDFDSDTPALIERATLNASRTEHDLESWIFDQVRPADRIRVADLGCGTGKQLFALAGRLSADSELVGVDISDQAVAAVNARAEREGRSNIRAVQASLDDCPGALPAGEFDLILSTYAIYYAHDVVALIERLAGVLRSGGTLFASGPGRGTNDEMVALVNDVADEPVPRVEDFIGDAQIAALAEHFSDVTVARLGNSAAFRSADEVLTWWRHHNMYRASAEEAVRGRLARAFAADATFRLTKNVLGLRCRA